MNNYSIKINNLIKSLKNLTKINPHKHWKFLLYFFLALVFLLIFFSFYLLYQINNEKVFQVKTGDTANKIILKDNILKRVLNRAELKANKELEIKTNGTTYRDPSI